MSQRKPLAIEPFWHRIPRFLLYPLTPPALYVLVLLALWNAFLPDLVVAASLGWTGLIAALLIAFPAVPSCCRSARVSFV